MPQRLYTIRPPTNPLLQALYFLLGAVVLIGVIFMSAVILVVVLGLAVVLGIILYVRIWWLRRKMARSPGSTGGSSGAGGTSKSTDSEVIEVEYTVVNERDERDD